MVKGGLRLKRELAPKPIQPPVGNLVLAKVWVDASVYHLDGEFSYLIPGDLSTLVQIGCLVTVPFNGREITGVVVSVEEANSQSGLKSISKVIGTIPPLTEPVLNLIREGSRRYLSHPFDLIRSAIPDRVATVEKEFIGLQASSKKSRAAGVLQYLQLPPSIPRRNLIAKKVQDLRSNGSVLVILPDSKEVSSLARELEELAIKYTAIDSSLPKSDLYRNFLKARLGLVDVVIGTRSAVFTPLMNLSSIVMYNEGSENLYERRSPGWNARDIALLRRHNEEIDLFFIGYSPSTEVARFIEEDWVALKRVKAKVNVVTAPQIHGELLPSRAVTLVRKALQHGPVLFLVPLKSYAQAIRCHKCRTISRCFCGGAHQKLSLSAPISCNHCSEVISRWKCSWCQSEEISMQARGAQRHIQELGALFPGVAAHLSTSEHPVENAPDQGFVVATAGMAPRSKSGYSAVVILEGNRFLNQPDMRSTERIREMYFSHAALVKSDGQVILVQDEGDQISTALSTWNPAVAVGRDLQERKSLSLPPYVRAAMMTLDTSEVVRFKNALLTAKDEGRLPDTTRILGPIAAGEKSSLILTVDIAAGDSLLSTLHEFMKRRSLGKKPLPSLRIDPYSLSH